jgi:hypothetical protein
MNAIQYTGSSYFTGRKTVFSELAVWSHEVKVIWMQVRTARHQWMAEEDGGVDDCTAIVCFLTRGNLKPGAITPAPLPAAGVSRPSISRHVACHMHRSKHHL